MINIKNATETDVEGMLLIYNDIIENTTAVYDYRPHTIEMRQAWFNEKLRTGFPVIVAAEDNKIVGFASFGPFRNWAAYKYSVENSVYVAADHRGKGIGKLLMQPLINADQNMNMHTIIASIDNTNEASLRLHQDFGFVEVAHFKEVGYKFGKWLDLKFLQLLLKGPKDPNHDIG